MAAEILKERTLEYFIESFELIPSDGGRFEFIVNDDLLFSKKQLGRHAEPGEIHQIFNSIVEKYVEEHQIVLPEDN